MKKQNQFPETNRLFEDFKKLGEKSTNDIYSTKDLQLLNDTFSSEYQYYIENKISFDGCPLSIYENNYSNSLKAYLSIYPDADEFDFLSEELNRVQTLHWDWKVSYSFYDYLDASLHRKNLNMSNEKVRDLIFKKNEALGHYMVPPFGIDEFDFFYSGRPADYWIVELKRNEEVSGFSKVENEEKILRITEIKMTSFKWSGKINQDATAINTLHKELLDNEFIDADLRSFKKVFEGIEITEPIKWISDSVNLVYLYHLLLKNKLIEGNADRKDWKKLKYCFDYPAIKEAQNLSQIINDTQTLHKKVFFENLVKSLLTE